MGFSDKEINENLWHGKGQKAEEAK
jgi:hypothetical protein